LHASGEPRGPARDQRPVRAREVGVADWPPDHRPPSRRGDGARARGGGREEQAVIEAVTEAHLPALRTLFEASSSPCFCRYWHFTGTKNEWLDRCAHHPEENARELGEAVRSGAPQGLIAVENGVVVGWMKLISRAAVPKLRKLPVYRNLDLGDES